MQIKIRFNTKHQDDPEGRKWRVLLNGEEFLAESVDIHTPSYTSEDLLPNGILKWHISTEGMPFWEGNKVSIHPAS